MDLSALITEQLKKHPSMGPADVLKLLYQNEFGPAHMTLSPEESLAALTEEFSKVEYEEDAELYEHIGNGYVRVNLAAVSPDEYPLARLNEDFLLSAEEARAQLLSVEEAGGASFLKKIHWVMAHQEDYLFAFSEEEFENAVSQYLSACKKTGYRPPKHSKAYENAEQPAYRVISEKRMHDFTKEKAAKRPLWLRILSRVLMGLLIVFVFVAIILWGTKLWGYFKK